MMTKAQFKAVYDYCDAIGCSVRELLQELKVCGVIEHDDKLEDLGEYVTGKDYETMLKFLEVNL